MADTPLISLLITARNDGYMGDFLWRLETTLNCAAHSAKVLNRLDAVECVVCDWGSEKVLHEVVRLSPEAQRITKFVVVPPEIALEHDADSTFNNSTAFNVAARYASGGYLGITGSDNLYTAPALQCLINVLEGKFQEINPTESIFTAGRRHIPVHVAGRQPPLPEFLEYIGRNVTYFPPDSGGIGTAAPTNLILLPRDMWHACHGIDETLIHWGWNDTNIVLRCCQRYSLVNLDHYGANVLHLEHWAKPRDYRPETMFRQKNKAYDDPAFAANDENWGIADTTFEVHRSELTAADDSRVSPSKSKASIQEIGSEVNEQPVLDLVKLLVESSQGLVPQREHGALQMLAWYASKRGPMNFVEVGMRYPFVAALVSRACPGVELYPLVKWERNQADEQLFAGDSEACLTYLANNVLRSFSRHWAYTQFIGGDFSTALDRLKNLRPGRFHLDLVLLRDSPFAPAQALELSSMLNPGGAMVILADNAASYKAIVGSIREKFPTHNLLSLKDGVTGTVISP